MYYFYCPNCGYQEEVKELPNNTVEDMYGYNYPVFLHKCESCGSEYAGFMEQNTRDMSEKVYQRSIISLYQEIRRRKNDEYVTR